MSPGVPFKETTSWMDSRGHSRATEVKVERD